MAFDAVHLGKAMARYRRTWVAEEQEAEYVGL